MRLGRMHPRPLRTLTCAAALAMTAACGTGTVTTAQAPADGAPNAPAVARTAPPEPHWEQLPDAPLSPRRNAVTAWTGTEALFLGGDTSAPCPPGADCIGPASFARDGAAYDPAKRSWRATAVAPADLSAAGTSAVLGDRAFVQSKGRLYSYDASDDAWTTHPAAPARPGGGLVATADRILLVTGSHEQSGKAGPDLSYDPEARTWSDLPLDPLGPSFDRVATWTAAGVVLTAHELVDQPGSAKPSIVRAARLDPGLKHWTRLPDSDQLGGWGWSWTGTRMVDPSLGGADGGQVNNYGRTIPFGGRLDPTTGAWTRLPDPPAQGSGGWAVQAPGGPLLAAGGWLYRDADGAWTRLERPSGAAAEPGSAVWAGPDLIVLGAADFPAAGGTPTLSPAAWTYRGVTAGGPSAGA